MKKLLLWLGILGLPGVAMANPYFRPVDIGHPQPVIGAMVDPFGIKNSEAASLLPLITHSPKDGCLLPGVVCEDWTPLAVGASMNAGKITLNIAPLANVLPWVQALALAVTPEKWGGLISALSPAPGSVVTFSAGPVWQYQQATNKGYFKVFTGLALHF